MNEKPQPPSGSRWEPAPEPSVVRESPAAGSGAPGSPATPPAEEQVRSTWASRPGWRDRLRGRGAMVGIATGIVALSGVGGFALGSAVADEADHPSLAGRDGAGGHPDVPRFDGRGVGPYDHDFGDAVPPGFDDDSPDPGTDGDGAGEDDGDDADAGDVGITEGGEAT